MTAKKSTNFLKRLVFSYTVVFSILMAILIIIATFVMIKAKDSERVLGNKLLINQPLKELERVLDNADDTAYRVMGNADILNQFTYLQEDGDESNFFDKNVLKSIDIGSVLANIDSKNNSNWRIVVYNDKGDFISHGTIVDKVEVNKYLDSDKVKAAMDYFLLNNKESEYDFILIPPEEDKWSNYFNSKYFSVIRPISNFYSNGNNVGLVEVQNSIEKIIKAVSFGPESGLYVNIYDDLGNPVLIQSANEKISCEVVSEKYNWKIQLVEDSSIRAKDNMRIITVMFTLWLLIVLSMYFIIKPIIKNITKPLTKLSNNLSELNPVLPEEISHIDTEINEIVALEKAFNNVLKERTMAMEYEKSAYFMALQSQINPHFINNVLSVINASAIDENYEMVMNISVDLSNMLRYSSSYESKSSNLNEELTHTETYFKLMKARFEGLFEYSIEVDKELLDYIVPKLIIQPICENSFMHGFSEIEPPYKIDVIIKRVDESISFRVIDNGKGFTEEKRIELLEKLNAPIDIEFSDKKIGGLGLASTILRLKLFTKQNVSCYIYSKNDDTVVEVIIEGIFL